MSGRRSGKEKRKKKAREPSSSSSSSTSSSEDDNSVPPGPDPYIAPTWCECKGCKKLQLFPWNVTEAHIKKWGRWVPPQGEASGVERDEVCFPFAVWLFL